MCVAFDTASLVSPLEVLGIESHHSLLDCTSSRGRRERGWYAVSGEFTCTSKSLPISDLTFTPESHRSKQLGLLRSLSSSGFLSTIFLAFGGSNTRIPLLLNRGKRSQASSLVLHSNILTRLHLHLVRLDFPFIRQHSVTTLLSP